MFLPFESIYAEVIRRTSLVETLQKDYKIVVTGPTTLGAILNSLQMGFRTVIVYDIWAVDMSYGSGTHPEFPGRLKITIISPI